MFSITGRLLSLRGDDGLTSRVVPSVTVVQLSQTCRTQVHVGKSGP